MTMNLNWLKIMSWAFVLTVYAPIQVASANVFHRDDRLQLTPKMGDELAKIGHLTNSVDRGRGTAFLVARCHILTNFHVAFSDESAPNLAETSFFVLGESAPILARPVIHGAYDPSRPLSSDEDWALLELETCVGDRYGWLDLVKLSQIQAADSTFAVSAAGFPSDYSLRQINVDPSCRIYPEFLKESREWAHDCASREGNSGSPIFFLDSSGKLNVIAIHSSTRGGLMEVFSSWSLHWGNGAVPVENFIDRVRSYLEALPKRSSLGKSH